MASPNRTAARSARESVLVMPLAGCARTGQSVAVTRTSPTTCALVVAVAVAAFLGIGTETALACSCTSSGTSSGDREALGRADAVFVGEVLRYDPPPEREVMSSADPATWTFAVTDVYKGDVTATQEVVSEVGGSSCGLEIPRRGTFLVFASRLSSGMDLGIGQYYAGLCGGTRSIDEAPIDLDVAPHSPDSGAPSEGSSDEAAAPVDDEEENLVVGLLAGSMIAIAGLIAIIAIHRHRASAA